MKKLSLIVVVGALLASNLALACASAPEDHSARDVNPKANIQNTLYSTTVQSHQTPNQSGGGVDGVYSSAPQVKRQANQNQGN